MEKVREIRCILGDQLDPQHSWFSEKDEEVLYVFMEVRDEASYTRHHIQKLLLFFAAMRRFAEQLTAKGHRVRYFRISDADNAHSFQSNLDKLVAETAAGTVRFQEADEYRLDQLINELSIGADLIVDAGSEHFLTDRTELAEHFKGKKTYLMESIYRMMRRKHNVLMDGDQPMGGDWNYDKANRNRLPRDYEPPQPLEYAHDLSGLMEEIKSVGLDYIGQAEQGNFPWPLDRSEALELLDYFIDELLPDFGRYQDAMSDRSWSIAHSRISAAMNMKMIRPMEVIRRVEDAYLSGKEGVDIAQAEGFIRQVLGWREYMRGIYWAQMPDYASLNFFGNDRPLPAWFWTGQTRMKCLSHAIGQSLEHAYAHHIQRLMVTGNFALLAGIDPDEVDQWYLGIYIDAIEWVEITNTRGMSQFADGGIVGSKPYTSSANYIGKMSDYCGSCHYKAKERTGDNACPFNSLYWRFHHHNREKLERNPRIGMVYRTWDRMEESVKNDILQQADNLLERIEEL